MVDSLSEKGYGPLEVTAGEGSAHFSDPCL